MVIKTFSWSLIVFMCIFAVSDGLFCYTCAGSISSSECATNTTRIVLARFQYENLYSKDCDIEINQTMCIIQTTEGKGELKTIIRGCSDGYTFSFDSKLFLHLRPTNQTQCTVTNGEIICITLCAVDYCNGPQELDIATRGHLDCVWLVIFQCLIQIYWSYWI